MSETLKTLMFGSGLICFGGFFISLVFIKRLNKIFSEVNLFVIRFNSLLWNKLFRKVSNPIKKSEKNLKKIGEASAKAFFVGFGFFSFLVEFWFF